MIGRPGVWLWAKFERVGPFELKVRCYESAEAGDRPPSFQILGIALKALHLAMGGPADHADDRVSAAGHAVVEVPGGRVQSISIWPTTEDEGKAREVYEQAWAFIISECQKMCGALGKVVESQVDGAPAIEVTYGPTVALESTLIMPGVAVSAPPPRKGRIVEMEVVARAPGRVKAS
jgi:hypothetical protein